MDLVKLELKDVFADKREMHNGNIKLDKLTTRIDQALKSQKLIDERFGQLPTPKDLKDLADELAAFKIAVEVRFAEIPKFDVPNDLNDSRGVAEEYGRRVTRTE